MHYSRALQLHANEFMTAVSLDQWMLLKSESKASSWL